MATSSGSLCKEQVTCSICLDVFTDPVTTPCGHNFCLTCIRRHRNNSPHSKCPLCGEAFDSSDFKINTTVKDISDHIKGKMMQVTCDSCSKRKRKNLGDYICKKHKRPLELFCRDDQTYVCYFCTETDHKSHNTVPTDEETTFCFHVQISVPKSQTVCEMLIKPEKNFKFFNQLIERSHAELLETMEEREKAAERQAEELITELEQEVSELKMKYAQLDRLSSPTFHPYQLQVSVLFTAPLQYNTVHHSAHSAKRDNLFDVTLDPDTAHPELLLTDDGKQVWNGGKPQNVPNSPARFDWCSCVLGKEGFSGGRLYYEVQVSGKTEWDLGMATESINRKGNVELGPENGSWTIWLRNGNKYDTNEIPPVHLSLKEKPQKVGVFVDYMQGVVSFYDVEAKYHIYSFTGQFFSQRLYPYFSPGENEGVLLNPILNIFCSV
uniref:Zinc-binding protein A33-like n=1 Tax=Pygocentrus nattereri TaxID=42514 RepID=A0A3B4CRV3_PYGNA